MLCVKAGLKNPAFFYYPKNLLHTNQLLRYTKIEGNKNEKMLINLFYNAFMSS